MDRHLITLPIIVPLLGALLALPSQKYGARLTLVVSLMTLGIDLRLLAASLADGPHVYWVGGWPPPYGITLVADVLSSTMAAVGALVAAMAALHTLTAGSSLREEKRYHPMFLTMLAALGGVFFTGDLFNLYVFMELTILSSFPLVAMAGRRETPEILFKYAVLAALGSAALLAGVAMVYAAVGTLNFAHIAQQAQNSHPVSWPLAAAALLFAFLLKAGIVPLHFWLPDAHSVAPTPVSAMLSGVLVNVGFYGTIRMQTLLFPEEPLLEILIPLGGISAIVGGLAAVTNPDVKRLLAYSTVSNMGLIFLALGWGGTLGMTAAVIHAVNHAVIKSGLFLASGAATEPLHDQHDLTRLGGLGALMPGTAAAFGLGAAAIAGLPPLNGFVSKLMLFQAGLEANDAPWLLVAAAAGALGIAYGLRAFVLLFWGKTPSWITDRMDDARSAYATPAASWVLAALCLGSGLWPAPLASLAFRAAAELENPGRYIHAVLGDSQ